MIDPQQARAEWLDMRSIQRLVDRAVRSPRLPLVDWWPERSDAVLGRHWPLVDHEWHRRRIDARDGMEIEERDDHVTRNALMPEGRLVRADRTRPVETSVQRGTTSTWGTRPTGEPFLSWPGSGLELLLKALIA